MVGRASYLERTNRKPTEWASNSSEAFTLLCVENYYDHIVDLAKNKPEIRSPKWTASARGAQRNQGWNKDGINRYREICKLVKEDRAKNKAVDERYMAREKELMDSILNKKRKRQHVVMARENVWDVAYEDEMSVGEDDNDELVQVVESVEPV